MKYEVGRSLVYTNAASAAMILLTVFLPLVNFLLFLLFGGAVSTKRLASYVIASIAFTLAGLLGLGPSVVAGSVQTAHLGVWVTSGLFEIN